MIADKPHVITGSHQNATYAFAMSEAFSVSIYYFVKNELMSCLFAANFQLCIERSRSSTVNFKLKSRWSIENIGIYVSWYFLLSNFIAYDSEVIKTEAIKIRSDKNSFSERQEVLK